MIKVPFTNRLVYYHSCVFLLLLIFFFFFNYRTWSWYVNGRSSRARKASWTNHAARCVYTRDRRTKIFNWPLLRQEFYLITRLCESESGKKWGRNPESENKNWEKRYQESLKGRDPCPINDEFLLAPRFIAGIIVKKKKINWK